MPGSYLMNRKPCIGNCLFLGSLKLYIVFFNFFLVSQVCATLNPIDKSVLLDIKRFGDSGTPKALSQWSEETEPCSWLGVVCNSNSPQHVTSISLDSLEPKLDGVIPGSITKLERLEILSLSNNRLSGSLPRIQPSQWKHLVFLNVRKNNLTGALESSLGNLISLEYLDVSHNNFANEIPPSIGSLQSLVYLFLSHNSFWGPIPASFENLSGNMRGLFLDHNRLSGTLPQYFGAYFDLMFLYLNNNLFSGQIPQEMASIIRDVRISLESNFLTGEVPLVMSHFFDHLHVSKNCLLGQCCQRSKVDCEKLLSI